jgi:GNAT superfamily N-acetyltransferase
MQVDITTTYLEMWARSALRPLYCERGDLEIVQITTPQPEFNRFLYTAVGGDWYWLDRLVWTYQQWLDWLDRPEVETWVAYVAGAPAGYFELEAQTDGAVELVYFGLLPQFIGQRLGGHLLTVAVERAWEMEARRVWLHTCTLDHPRALANYCARGFRVARQETHSEEIPDTPIGPWPGAREG